MCYQRCVHWRAWFFFVLTIYQSRCLIPTHVNHAVTTDASALTSHQLWSQVAPVQQGPMYDVRAGPPNVPWVFPSPINQGMPWVHPGSLNQGIPHSYLTPFAQVPPAPAAFLPPHHIPQPNFVYGPNSEVLGFPVHPLAHPVILGNAHNYAIESGLTDRVASWPENSERDTAAQQPHLHVTGSSLNAHALPFNPDSEDNIENSNVETLATHLSPLVSGATLEYSQTLRSVRAKNANRLTSEPTTQVHLRPESQKGLNVLAPEFKPSDAGPSWEDTTSTEALPSVDPISKDVSSPEFTSKNAGDHKSVYVDGISSSSPASISEPNYETKGSTSSVETVTQHLRPTLPGMPLHNQAKKSERGKETETLTSETGTQDHRLSQSEKRPTVVASDIITDEKTRTSGVDQAAGEVGPSWIQGIKHKANPEFTRENNGNLKMTQGEADNGKRMGEFGEKDDPTKLSSGPLNTVKLEDQEREPHSAVHTSPVMDQINSHTVIPEDSLDQISLSIITMLGLNSKILKSNISQPKLGDGVSLNDNFIIPKRTIGMIG
ncbi:hypothetical protein PCASD_19811 [Puccinia coronata f. sp. avenae]|uniref:Ataxin-2 C-terminal domain-containing protein n=2 Tax=Puccinia coronata f. sp. avenae TaxID=200324 RepID=A0A2N5SXS2_9BASI|nr:hypothetical protein PCASD_19811 [Puccinia coronata f. sp. avenae]